MKIYVAISLEGKLHPKMISRDWFQDHLPSKYTNPAGKRQNGQRKLVVCSKHKKRIETIISIINNKINYY